MTKNQKSDDIKSALFSLDLKYSNFNIEEIEKETGYHITSVMVKNACYALKKFRNLLDLKSGKTKKKKIDEFRNDNSFIKWCNVIILIQAYKK